LLLQTSTATAVAAMFGCTIGTRSTGILGGRSFRQCGLAGLFLVALAALIGHLWAGRIKKGDRTRIGIA
jgi:hypothetical protein